MVGYQIELSLGYSNFTGFRGFSYRTSNTKTVKYSYKNVMSYKLSTTFPFIERIILLSQKKTVRTICNIKIFVY